SRLRQEPRGYLSLQAVIESGPILLGRIGGLPVRRTQRPLRHLELGQLRRAIGRSLRGESLGEPIRPLLPALCPCPQQGIRRRQIDPALLAEIVDWCG